LKNSFWLCCYKKIKPSHMKKYASGLIFFCASPERFLNRLPVYLFNAKKTYSNLQNQSPKTLFPLLLLCIALSWGCVAKAPAPAPIPAPIPTLTPADTGLFLPDGRPLSQEAFTALIQDADYVLIGESHGSYCDHAAQAFFLRLLAGRGPVAVGLEMVPTDKQPVLDQFNQGSITLEILPQALDWAGIWGHPFPPYEPVFRTARDLGLPVYGLNVPRRLMKRVRDVGMKGASPEERRLLPKRIIPPPKEQELWLLEQMTAHHDEMGDRDMEKFFLVQSLWDTALAESAVALHATSNQPVAILAGSGHVTHGWGVAHRLKILDLHGEILLVMPWREDEKPEAGAAHVFYKCPPTPQGRLGMAFDLENSQHQNRVTISDIRHGSPADSAGLRPRDRILRAGGREVLGLEDLHKAGKDAAAGNGFFHMEVERGHEIRTFKIRLPKAQEQ
jgi:uncharacterized iron-regulated protein